jgi:hypothetical protein
MKKTIFGLLVLLFLALPEADQAQYAYSTNDDGSVYAYTTNADGSASIAAYSGPPWAVAIPTNVNGLTVTGISASAFYDCTNLTSVTVPDSVTSIGMDAFELCPNLASILIPGSVTNIGAEAFRFCASLPILVIPAGVANIESATFELCTSLTNVAIPSTVTSIGNSVFNECISLTHLTIPDSVTNIGDAAFDNCTSLASLTIPAGVNGIGNEAFENCTSLRSIAIPGGVTSIMYAMCYACTNLTSLTIAGSVTNLGKDAFDNCTSMASVYFGGNAPVADSTTFHFDLNTTAYYLPGTTGWDAFSADTGVPVILWNPIIQTGDGSFGVQNNQFGFNITGTNNFTVVVEACTNLTDPVWTPLQTLTLTNGSVYFSDPQWTNYPFRYYGLGFP